MQLCLEMEPNHCWTLEAATQEEEGAEGTISPKNAGQPSLQ